MLNNKGIKLGNVYCFLNEKIGSSVLTALKHQLVIQFRSYLINKKLKLKYIDKTHMWTWRDFEDYHKYGGSVNVE